MQYVIVLTLFAAPLYAWPFGLAGFSTNILMLWLGLVWACFFFWMVQQGKLPAFVRSVVSIPKLLLLAVAAFFLAGVMSLFVGGISVSKIGQFLVLFVQPIGTFFVTRFVHEVFPQSKKYFLYAAYVFVAATGLYAIIQYFTLIGVPAAWWGNHVEPKRSLSFFVHPNFYGLFVTPLLAFLIPDAVGQIKDLRFKIKGVVVSMAWVLGAAGLLFSLSRGAWIGLAGAGMFYLLFQRSKWIWWHALLVFLAAVNIAWAVPSVRYRLTAPFQGERSANARLSLWETGLHMIKDSPIAGKGLTGFSKNYEVYSVDKTLEHHPTPHNLFLQTWVELGVLGLVSFAIILLFVVLRAIRKRTDAYAFGTGLAVIAIFFHGLIDTPYFKNDLASLFWILLAFL